MASDSDKRRFLNFLIVAYFVCFYYLVLESRPDPFKGVAGL
jgi:hypothetical protein